MQPSNRHCSAALPFLLLATTLTAGGCATQRTFVATGPTPHVLTSAHAIESNSAANTPPDPAKYGLLSFKKTAEPLPQNSPVQTVAYQTENDIMSSETLTPEFDEETITLGQLEALALQNNSAIAAAQHGVSKSAGLAQQVATRPNPTIGYFASQLADAGTAQNGFFIDQEIVRGNKLALNREVLRHTTQAQCWEVEVQRHRVLTDVRIRFYEALAAQGELDATDEFIKVARQGVEFSSKRTEAGEGTQIEVLQSKTLLSEINLAREQAIVAYRGAWQSLSAVAGISSLEPARLLNENAIPASRPNWEHTYAEIVARSPELKVAHEHVREKLAFLKRQQVQSIPNLSAQLGAGYDSATESGLINLQFAAPIPIRNKNDGNLSAACADYHVAVENVNRIEQSIQSRLAGVAQEFDAANAAVQKYETEIIPQAKEALALSETGYSAGELDFVQVLIVRRSYFDATVKLVQARGRLSQAAAKIHGLLLSGGLDAPADYTAGDGLRDQSLGGQ